jgi:hypothetical protein
MGPRSVHPLIASEPARVAGLLLLACAVGLTPALAAERVGDAVAMYALQDRARIVDDLERALLVLIEASPGEDRFDLYRTYNQLSGTWVQMQLSQTLIEQAVSAQSPSDEASTRMTLRDQAQFALWELDEARLYLERNAPAPERREHFRINRAIRALLAETRTIVERLLVDQCDLLRC